MKLTFTNKINQDIEVVFHPVLQDENQINSLIKKINPADKELILQKIKKQNFIGRKAQTFVFDRAEQVIILLGTGQAKKLSIEDWRNTAGWIIVCLKKYFANNIGLVVRDWLKGNSDIEHLGQALAEGLVLANYNFDKYKKLDKNKIKVDIKQIVVEISAAQRTKLGKGWQRGLLLAQGAIKARDLINEPGSQVTPTFLAKEAQQIVKQNKNISVKILDRPAIKKLGMDAFLGVDQGSHQPPKLIHLVYKPKATTKDKIALIGKGITFDSGGLNIKSFEGMAQMKNDMAGAASVLGLFSVISQLNLKVEVHGIIAACENMPSGRALKPGDIVKSMQGKTIEIGNTDAEGRVTLADALTYIQKQGIKKIIDLATLTGACMVALGTDYAGLFSNNNQLTKELLKATEVSGEKLWRLPLPEEYRQLNKSKVADIRNIPVTRLGEPSTAALFLQEFIEKDVIWSHWDIAGPAYAEKPMNSYIPTGGVGFGVRTLLEWLK
ncbi:MAG: leucyl aminopeptidase [Candidatus Komeilibacteria bacterium CG11_big_fil_rev_8_21_14_0_20_36_20]|uniref:Probable cytosol aminopeptidase n=1 Tax=Candidatus Komeilibacteria bacterium CG11_big_fil_rev_8_21_14_0_20_36_20 TaxID=1974477 RepID=A0A2H0NDV4_9BACT|nr:MAG: leucyl aminopeptidase [Candidatus Komeilibacteria bacterium CG11_big_fil_rev_8_21_14_0_20_36_20]PIR81212.1 MAG: leucyl aminopeptidase [Candidatus Komeilibacteria bacterium CG10_big_fil_rev_8_21_14_0_10_36_65]PJC55176.1 MAG: leucyl aminopeptidase [Candidatus Komeilibacteria bacterium CG_4_9_14_0_2_um_filter_36_13]